MLSKFTVLVHRPFSTTVQQDVTLFLMSENLILATSTTTTRKVTDISTSSHYLLAHGLGTKVMFHMTLINVTVLTYYAGIIP